MSTYEYNSTGPGTGTSRAWTQFKPLPRKYPTGSNPVVYRDGTVEILTHIATVDMPPGVR